MADDLKSILKTYIPTDVIGIAGTDYILEYIYQQTPDEVTLGIILEEVRGDLQQKGYTRQKTDAHAGDWYECHCIGDTKEQLDYFISQILKASVLDPDVAYGFKGNTTYSQIDPDVSDVQKGGTANGLLVKFLILCVKNNKDIF